MVKFLHAADLHLDSPLRGLERYDGAPVDEIRTATRRALENLVRLAIEEQVRFVLIAGDLYDGDWKDYNTGLFLRRCLGELNDAGIEVFLIAGNHDAANRMTKALSLPPNVRMLANSNPETIVLDDCSVAIHGQSFATQRIDKNLALGYPPAKAGCFNIGLLHTSVDGRPGHDSYAPCSVEDLRGRGYDYWALGHIHRRETLSQDPWIAFSGNVQGRHIRETGSKGCLVVAVEPDHNVAVEFRSVDVLRWCRCRIDASQDSTPEAIVDRFAVELQRHLEANQGLPLAVRVELVGGTPAHAILAADPIRWTNEIRGRANDLGQGSVWIEKVKIHTTPVSDLSALMDGPIGELVRYIDELKKDANALTQLADELRGLANKLPQELQTGPEALDLTGADGLRQLLEPVRQMLLQRLHTVEDAP